MTKKSIAEKPKQPTHGRTSSIATSALAPTIDSVLGEPVPSKAPERTELGELGNAFMFPLATENDFPAPVELKSGMHDFSVFETSTPVINQPTVQEKADQDFSASEPSPPEIIPTPPVVLDPWQDADFSIFESAHPAQLPPSSSTTIPTKQGSPTPLPDSSHVHIPTRSDSNPSKRGEAEAEDVIRGIISGLPDLRYMLQR
jgi:hypothetical protein